MIASKDSKVVVYKEYSPVMFVEDVNFKVLYGVSRRVKTGERISGDNFAFIEGMKIRRSLLFLTEWARLCGVSGKRNGH